MVKEFNKPASKLLFERTPSKGDNSCLSSFSVERFNKEDLVGYITNDPDPLTMISFLYNDSGPDKESTVVEYIQKLPKSLVVSLNSQGKIVELLKILTNSDKNMTEAKQQAILKLLYCLDINYVEDVLKVLNSKYGTGDDWVIDHLISKMGDNSEFVDLATDLYVKRYTYLENVFGHILNFNSVLNPRELFCVKLLEKLPEENYLHFIRFLQDNNSKMMRNIIKKIDDFSLFNSDRNYSNIFEKLLMIYSKSNIYDINKLVAVNLDESSVMPIKPGEIPEYFYEIAYFDDIENSDFLTISSRYKVDTIVKYEDESGWQTMQITLPKCITSIRVNFWDPVLITNQETLETLETVQKAIFQGKNIEYNGLKGVLVPAVFLHYIKDKQDEIFWKNAAKGTAITAAIVIGAVACPNAVLVAAVKATLARKAVVNFAKGAAEDVVKSVIVEKMLRELGLSDDENPDPSWSAVFSSKLKDVNTYKSAIVSGVKESFKFNKLSITLPLSCIEGIEVDKLYEQMKKGDVNNSDHIIGCASGAFFEFLGTQEGKEFLQRLKDKLGIYKFFKKYNVKYDYRIKLLELLYKNKKRDELVIIDAFFQLKIKEEGSSKYLINRNISIDKDIDVTEEIVQFVEDKTDGTKICAFSHKNGGEFSINLYKLKEIKDSYGKFKGEYEFVQFAEDVVKKLSQGKITDALKEGVDDVEKFIDENILGKIKEFEEQ